MKNKKWFTHKIIMRQNKKGFTLIESLVLLFIFGIVVMTFYKMYALVTHYSLETKYRTAAVELATAEMEILRNTPYENIILDPATSPPDSAISGESGTGLDYDRTKTVNSATYRILTEIYYVDDPEDGENGAGDTISNDYKRVNITILWGDGMSDASNTSKSILLTSFFVPPSGSETAIENGILSVNVVDSNGDAVEGASVNMDDINSSFSDSINTGSDGNVLFEDVPVGMDMYQVTVSKTDSEYIQTTAKGDTPADPVYAHASVLPGTITTLTIVQDIDPNFSIITKDPFGNVLTSIGFTFTGGRMLGLDTNGDPVYINIDRTATSGSTSGEVDCDDVSGYTASVGKYNFTLDDESNYTLWKFNPISSAEHNTVEVTANIKNLDDDDYNGDGIDDNEMVILDNNVNGVIVSVTDSLTLESFGCVTVQLKRTESPIYDQSQQTDIYGKVYFPVDLIGGGDDNDEPDGIIDEELITDEKYDITVTAPTCVDDCVNDCNNDCIENACVDGCVVYVDDCTSYYEYTSGSFYKYYADEIDDATPTSASPLQTKDIILSPDTTP